MSLLNCIGKLKDTKILIVGDVGLDEYVNGKVQRISPEAPVPVVEVESEEVRMGLATNVAQNIASLGGVPMLVSVIGQDTAGGVLKDLLNNARVSAEYLIEDSDRPTTRKLRVMSQHHHVVRVDYERRKFLTPELEQKILSQVGQHIAEVKGVILQDYAKGVLSKDLIQKVISLAKQNNCKVIVDPHRSTPLDYYFGADLMTPNAEEAIELSQLPIDELRAVSEDFLEVGAALMKAVGSERMVITRSKEGMSLFEDGKVVHVPTVAKEVFDVTGAGDTVVAALALAWCSDLSLKESCDLANHAAGVVVAHIGCVPCTLDQLKSSLP